MDVVPQSMLMPTFMTRADNPANMSKIFCGKYSSGYYSFMTLTIQIEIDINRNYISYDGIIGNAIVVELLLDSV